MDEINNANSVDKKVVNKVFKKKNTAHSNNNDSDKDIVDIKDVKNHNDVIDKKDYDETFAETLAALLKEDDSDVDEEKIARGKEFIKQGLHNDKEVVKELSKKLTADLLSSMH